MAKFKSRRRGPGIGQITGRAWEDAVHDIQKWADNLTLQIEGGIPAGFNAATPTTIGGGPAADPGTEGSGWAAADHQHELDISGTPGIAGSPTSVQGIGPGVSLSGHTHALELTDAVVVGISVFTPRAQRIPKVQAGTNVTIVENALGPVISSSGGAGAAVDDASNIIANRVFGG